MRVIGLAVLLMYALLTTRQASVYQSELRLWQQATTHTPTFRAFVNYRNALLADGQIEAAIALCDSLTASAVTARDQRTLGRLCLASRSSR